MVNPPAGTVTFLFTDIEGSTKLARAYPETWDSIHARHDAILRAAIEAHGGTIFQMVGDECCAAFLYPFDALEAALQAQQDLQTRFAESVTLRVRMGLHTGEAEIDGTTYRGYLALSLNQRLMSAGHGGQILLSQESADLVRREHEPSAGGVRHDRDRRQPARAIRRPGDQE